MKPITPRWAAVVVAGLLLLTLLTGFAEPATTAPRADATVPVTDPAARPHPPARVVKKRKIAPGLTFTRIIQRKIPRRTFILRIDPTKAVSLDVALAEHTLPARDTVLAMAKANEALAAVNGDFTDPDIGRPTHPFAVDGELVQTAVQRGPLFALARDERTAYLGKPDLRISISDRSEGRSWRVDRWNQGPPAPGEIAGYSAVGGTLEMPPDSACSVRLLPEGPRSLDPDGDGVVQDYVVDVAECANVPMTRGGGIVLSAQPATDEATQLLALAPGTPMRLRWSLGWSDVYDVVGGMPILVQDGQTVTPTCSTAFCRANPRTGIGVTGNGGVVLVVVDGRQPRWSLGPTLAEFATIMRNLGAVQALNLDGGGSTTMVVEGKVVNRPSDDVQRHISNAVLVLPGPDPGEA